MYISIPQMWSDHSRATDDAGREMFMSMRPDSSAGRAAPGAIPFGPPKFTHGQSLCIPQLIWHITVGASGC